MSRTINFHEQPAGWTHHASMRQLDAEGREVKKAVMIISPLSPFVLSPHLAQVDGEVNVEVYATHPIKGKRTLAVITKLPVEIDPPHQEENDVEDSQ